MGLYDREVLDQAVTEYKLQEGPWMRHDQALNSILDKAVIREGFAAYQTRTVRECTVCDMDGPCECQIFGFT